MDLQCSMCSLMNHMGQITPTTNAAVTKLVQGTGVTDLPLRVVKDDMAV